MNKIYIFLTIFGLFVLAGCTATTENSQKNSQPGGNVNQNKPLNQPAKPEKTGASPAEEKPVPNAVVSGNWDSEKLNAAGNKHTEVSFSIKQDGDKISGIYSVVDFIGKDPQIEDGNQTPFVGTVKGNTATIKFDPENVHPGYDEDVKYKAPADGKAPATATLTLSGTEDLQCSVTSGSFNENVPKKFSLKKAKE